MLWQNFADIKKGQVPKNISEDRRKLYRDYKKKDGEMFMSTIGILGGNATETALLFLGMCQKKGLKALVDVYSLAENKLMPIVSIDENGLQTPQVWLLQDATDYVFGQVNDGYLVVNTDGEIVPVVSGVKGVITYGFNSKASVTASSVADGALQVCIQRGFRTLGGSEYEPQEFRADCPGTVDPVNVLGAVAAGVMCGVVF